MFILTTFSSSPRSLAISSTTGATIRHGPHHGAQKSTRTGTSASMTSAWKLTSVTSATMAIATPCEVQRDTSKSIASAGSWRDGCPSRVPLAFISVADPTNSEIAAALDELGDLYELDGAIIHR